MAQIPKADTGQFHAMEETVMVTLTSTTDIVKS